MTVEASRFSPQAALSSWRRDALAGVMASVVTLPVCLATGVLVFAPLGAAYVAAGAAGGLSGAIVGGALAALLATSTFIITSPRVNPSLVQASLILALLSDPAFAGNPKLIFVALALCILLAGLWQILFGLFGVAGIIKFTPHPVLAGFLNGVALVIITSQLKPFFTAGSGPASYFSFPDRPAALLFTCAVGAFILAFGAFGHKLFRSELAKKIPAPFAGLIGGIAVFYLVKTIAPDVDLGPTMGRFQIGLSSPLAGLLDSETAAVIFSRGASILIVSLVLAIVATIDTLLAFRAAQNLADIDIRPVRDLAAQGLANCGSALAGGIYSAASPPQSMAAYRSGGRTRWTGVTSALVILVLGGVFSPVLSAIPGAVLSGILLAMGFLLFDRWSLNLLGAVLRDEQPFFQRRAVYDLLVIVVVMGTILITSVVIGVLVGSLVAGIIFIINMSRPVVRQVFLGNEIFSRRIRPAADVAILRETGPRRAILQLEGVLFFGNADDLARDVKRLFARADMVALDLRAVTDIDISGANVLRNLVNRSRDLGKRLLFCNVPPWQAAVIRSIVDDPAAKEASARDLDSTLEWMEEAALAECESQRGTSDLLRLDEIDFLDGLTPDELREVEKVMTRRVFGPGDIICCEGDAGDRMWLLLKGSVSVRLKVADHRGTRRIASLARGTTVGEMALIERARRSASIVADEDVVCCELDREGFDAILRNRPAVAAKMLSNLARELTRRLRRTSEDLRHTSS